MTLYHCTTPKKLARYKASRRIISPVRGFSTELAAKKWCELTGRTIILSFESETPWKLPDHHNRFGTAWWNEGDVLNYTEIFRNTNLPLHGHPKQSPIKGLKW